VTRPTEAELAGASDDAEEALRRLQIARMRSRTDPDANPDTLRVARALFEAAIKRLRLTVERHTKGVSE